MIDAQDKMTGLIRRAIEDKGHLELVTSPGKPTPRGGYDTTWMFAQNGTDTFLTIEVAWYPQSASFTLTGPAVERAEDAFWADRGLIRSRQGAGRGPLQCRLLVPYAGGDRADLLLAVLPGLLAPYHAEKTADSPGLHVVVAASDGTEHHHRVSGDGTLTVLVEGQPVLGVDRHGPGRWTGEEWQRLYSADRVTDRSVAIEGIATEAQWHNLELAFGLNRGDLNQVRDLVGGQPSAGEAPTVAHLAARVETAAEALRVAAGAGPVSGESAAAVAGHLQAALDHIAGTLSPAVSDALPHAARHLDVAATRIGLTADLISSAGPVIATTAGRTADFPGEVRPMAPGQGEASPSPSAASRLQTAKPAKDGRAR